MLTNITTKLDAGPVVKLGYDYVKQAGDGVVVKTLAGRLYHKSGSMGDWIMLSVPNAFVRGVFSALDEPGIQLPVLDEHDTLNAHISVIRPEELAKIGGPDAMLRERGRQFRYGLGELIAVNPKGWPGVEKCWFIKVSSPELQELRRTYGLTSLPNNGKFDFHITVAIRKSGVRTSRSVSLAKLTEVPREWLKGNRG